MVPAERSGDGTKFAKIARFAHNFSRQQEGEVNGKTLRIFNQLHCNPKFSPLILVPAERSGDGIKICGFGPNINQNKIQLLLSVIALLARVAACQYKSKQNSVAANIICFCYCLQREGGLHLHFGVQLAFSACICSFLSKSVRIRERGTDYLAGSVLQGEGCFRFAQITYWFRFAGGGRFLFCTDYLTGKVAQHAAVPAAARAATFFEK